MDPKLRELIQRVHDMPGRIVLVTAGAGTQALAWLLGVAGASRTLLEALVPYDWAAFNDFLGHAPAQYVAAPTARLMAGRALTRARWLHEEENLIGLACTATIATDRPKRGEHRAHIATWQAERVTGYSLYLEKGARDRQGEEEIVSRLLLNALARAFGLPMQLDLALHDADAYEEITFDLGAAARRLHQGAIATFAVAEDGVVAEEVRATAILSGAFNPLHEGHLALARAAQQVLGKLVTFELAACNVDKPPLAVETVLQRMAQFAGCWPVSASNAPTFVEKAHLYPGATFVVGYDTAARILHKHYYDDDEQKMKAALAEIRRRGCNFLVAGRVGDEGHFHTSADLAIPGGFSDLFRPLLGFRRDISSTELRAAGRRGSR